jgi:hypothetical protein
MSNTGKRFGIRVFTPITYLTFKKLRNEKESSQQRA